MANEIQAYAGRFSESLSVVVGATTLVTVAPAPSMKGWKRWNHGDTVLAPAKFDKSKGKWVARWPISTDPDLDELGNAESNFLINKNGTKLTVMTHRHDTWA